MEIDHEQFAKRLHEKRRRRGLGIADCIEHAKSQGVRSLGRATWEAAERGYYRGTGKPFNPDEETLAKIALALDVTYEEVCSWAGVSAGPPADDADMDAYLEQLRRDLTDEIAERIKQARSDWLRDHPRES